MMGLASYVLFYLSMSLSLYWILRSILWTVNTAACLQSLLYPASQWLSLYSFSSSKHYCQSLWWSFLTTLSMLSKITVIEKLNTKEYIWLCSDEQVVCLYLQFSWTESLYRKCCAIPDNCCRYYISRRLKRRQKREAKYPDAVMSMSPSPDPMSPPATSSTEHSLQGNDDSLIFCE